MAAQKQEMQKVGVVTITYDGRRVKVMLDAGDPVVSTMSIAEVEPYLMHVADAWCSAGVVNGMTNKVVRDTMTDACHSPGKECTIG